MHLTTRYMLFVFLGLWCSSFAATKENSEMKGDRDANQQKRVQQELPIAVVVNVSLILYRF